MNKHILTSMNSDELKGLLKEILEESNLKDIFLSKQEKKRQDFLTTSDLLKQFNICRTTLYLWRKKGLIPYHRIGRRIYFLEHEVVEAVKKIDFNDLSSFPYRQSVSSD